MAERFRATEACRLGLGLGKYHQLCVIMEKKVGNSEHERVFGILRWCKAVAELREQSSSINIVHRNREMGSWLWENTWTPTVHLASIREKKT